MNPEDVRRKMIARLEQDLIGPHSDDEKFEGARVRPSDIYLTGMLWPGDERMDAADDDGTDGDSEDDEGPAAPSPVGQQRPCSMGISFCVQDLRGESPIDITIGFATYPHEQHGAGLRWTRKSFSFELKNFTLPEDGTLPNPRMLESADMHAHVELHVRCRPSAAGRLVTVTLINRSRAPRGDRNQGVSLMLFQTSMQIRPAGSTRIVPRPPGPVANDDEAALAQLLYRMVPEFATGHQCSASWEGDAATASLLETEWIPQAPVIAFREDGHDVFKPLVEEGVFVAKDLSSVNEDEALARLARLPEAYGKWIEEKTAEMEAANLAPGLQEVARTNLETCAEVQGRIAAGIQAMRDDPLLLRSFQLANSAMALQHSWKGAANPGTLKWRPFQLGFILLAADSTCRGDAPDRNVLDLLWFPTGGGKTEAYLALIAMLAFYRRLVAKDPDDGAGNAAVMRYTLRLLTAQQFERATALILACELIRLGRAPGPKLGKDAGRRPFSIGLWVGKDATPNDYADALAKRGNTGGSTAEQIHECPCCHQRVYWDYDGDAKSVQPRCDNNDCDLGKKAVGAWPVFTVDSDIYRESPTLVIGTIDKFALLPNKTEMAQLFGFGTSRSTDLIIQDELHLISGPLGTIAGVYEVAFDWLLRKNEIRPKVIGSTATIRRAEDQIRALFDRESCQFPPPGLVHDDSGFAVRDPAKEPRLYLGVTTAGRSAKFALQAVAGSLLQSGGNSVGISDADRDGYATLLLYFNSLRELGGAIVQMVDDVPDSIALYGAQRNESSRGVTYPRELTSHRSQKEIIEILADLKIAAGNPGALDVVLATNMVSVGVDVSRLGLMLMNGQPKTRSEYIQATSRVGRRSFPGLVVTVLNAAKPRDRSHYETFCGWHASLYRDVEATSVTPFASRARDRALHATLVAMIRHGAAAMAQRPDLTQAPNDLLQDVIAEIERRVDSIDSRENTACTKELDERLQNWGDRSPEFYNQPHKPNKSLLISADLNAQRKATGRLPSGAWPTMNNMRSVEATTRFRMAEMLTGKPPATAADIKADPNAAVLPNVNVPRWRKSDAR
jgi:hypothetical protein